MTRRVLVLTLLLIATAFTGSAFATNDCAGTPTIKAIGVGSSGLYNSMSYAMVAIVSNNTFDTTSYSMISNKASNLLVQDSRFTTALNDTPTITVVWSNNDTHNNCNVYAYFSLDSGIGIKDFFAWKKVPDQANDGTLFSVAAVYPNFSTSGSCNVGGSGFCSGNKVNGLKDNLQGLTALPFTIYQALNTPPVPTNKLDTPHAHGLDYCGYSTGGSAKAGTWCFFNFGASDERPEDNLFMVTRALSTLNTNGGTLAGLGYQQGGCLAGTDGAAATKQGCPILDAFGQNSYFNVLTYKLSGTDPISSGTIPAYTSLRMGAVPILVFVNNADSSSTLGFGTKYTDSGSAKHYTFTNINKKVLSLVFDGTLDCTGDLLPGTPAANNNVYDNGFIAGPPPGPGQPIQVVQREMLSGTYTAFEFSGVRTLTGSGNPFAAKPSATTWVSDADSGQEYGNDPITNFTNSHCAATTITLNAGLATPPDGTVTCGDPLYLPTGTAGKKCGQGARMRAIGTGEEVPGVIGRSMAPKDGTSTQPANPDGIGYAFWSYGNFAPLATGCATNSSSQFTTCSSQYGHYLTVDGVDPLFITQGGEFDSAYGGTNNPAGAFNPPQCNFGALGSPGSAGSCFAIPFTHVYDGTYPLWSINSLVTFQNVGSGSSQTLFTPPDVINLVANAEVQVANASHLSDFVPLYNNINLSNSPPTGNLNLGVFRSHYKETNNPNHGHSVCTGGTPFNNVQITGTTKGTTNKCLVDAGADAGGEVLTVQGDYDFGFDAGSLFLNGGTVVPAELYNLRH